MWMEINSWQGHSYSKQYDKNTTLHTLVFTALHTMTHTTYLYIIQRTYISHLTYHFQLTYIVTRPIDSIITNITFNSIWQLMGSKRCTQSTAIATAHPTSVTPCTNNTVEMILLNHYLMGVITSMQLNSPVHKHDVKLLTSHNVEQTVSPLSMTIHSPLQPVNTVQADHVRCMWSHLIQRVPADRGPGIGQVKSIPVNNG